MGKGEAQKLSNQVVYPNALKPLLLIQAQPCRDYSIINARNPLIAHQY